MILREDDGASDVLPTCFSIPTPRPSTLSWHIAEARAGEHDLEHDGRHCTCRDVFIFAMQLLDWPETVGVGDGMEI